MTNEEAIDIIKCLAWHTRPNEEDIEQAIKALEKEPKTGRWIRVDDSKLKCSECEVVHFIAQYPSAGQINFCPNCGARMD